MKIYNLRSSFLLMLTALIWGSAFVAQSVGMDYIGPFTFNSIRCFIGGLVLLPCIAFLDRGKGADKAAEVQKHGGKLLMIGGICCGVALAVGSTLQQFGIMYTSVGKAGFITALYIVIVPVLGIALGKRVGRAVWAAVVLAVAGMYLLCVTEGLRIGMGDFLVFLGSIAFSVHILVIDYFSPQVDCVRVSCIQFFVCGVVCAVPMLVWERPALGAIFAAWLPLLYAGALSCGVGYTLQIVAQKGMDPTVASLLLSLESVFAALSGWALLHQRLSPRELTGCALVFCAIILAQLPGRRRNAGTLGGDRADNRG